MIDVLLPVFNAASTVAEAIESVRRQTVAEQRIIVIDDGSTDHTPEILAGLARQDSRITVLRQRNGGIVDALNAGLERCAGTFIARQDADDISDASRLAMQLDYLERHPDCVAVSGAVRHIDETGRRTGNTQYFASPDAADARWAPSREPYLCHPFLMVRREAMQSVGGYRHVHNSEDTDLYWRLSERGRLHNLDLPIGDYRMHAGSISGGSIANGRIMALSSQLAGVSALRRKEGRPDLRFDREMIAEYRRVPTLSGLYELGRQQLDKAEAEYLRLAMAAKLLELTSYRPYELELDDCVFIREARDGLQRLTAANRTEFHRLHAAAVARLLKRGQMREAAALAPPSLYAPAAARLAAMALPGSLRHVLIRPRERRRKLTDGAVSRR
ncbi:Glycosyl transferase family 2 [Rhizobiales bacterium GAS191]|jgi:glycosyltransferase involved in cell wall biosynthesis|nr:Glycosyl transferase family 2 [Rhizobiales bacterium GAS113]SEE13625.1 Glycosyl transferase family 2 [Rhizobiales bacterium GAS188]SEE43503.1 Glycosyl transferase family 2 [Rhizobiales bacterium GAS191]